MSSTDTEHRKALMSVFARARDRWPMLPKTLHICALHRRYRTLESFTSLQAHRFVRHYRECGQPSMAKGAKPLHQPTQQVKPRSLAYNPEPIQSAQQQMDTSRHSARSRFALKVALKSGCR
jgi:hypothetical protein